MVQKYAKVHIHQQTNTEQEIKTEINKNNTYPIAKLPGLLIPITSPGYATSIDSRSLPNNVCAVAKLYLLFGLERECPTFIPLWNDPETIRIYANRSRCRGSKLACVLNTNPENS